MLAVKGNQGRLEQAFDDYFRMDMLQDFDGRSYITKEKNHGRMETRLALVNRDLSVLGDIEHEWPELKSMGIVASIRQESDVANRGIRKDQVDVFEPIEERSHILRWD